MRVNGPIVEADGMETARIYEVVEVGPQQLVGEVIKAKGSLVTVQVYEHTVGLKPGQEVRRTGHPLSLELGPGLTGHIFDGMQRPLDKLTDVSGPFIERGVKTHALDREKTWTFSPAVREGDELRSGEVFGHVMETPALEHRLMAPNGAEGRVVHIESEGEFTVDSPVCVLEAGDGRVELSMIQLWPARRPRPFGERLSPDQLLVTGQRVIDTFFPIARGGVAAIPGDFGTGKTMTQQSLAKWSDADLVVYVGCGERGNEMSDVLREFPKLQDPRTGRSIMERTVLVANTSNMPVAAREISIYTGVTIAEYYRDMGHSVALMADSTSRWAEALREVSSRLEEMPAEEGFPAYLASRLAEFYERAGRVRTLAGGTGDITIVGAVSPPGGDFSEPVTQHTKRYTRCFWALDRNLAHARHYPAISWLNSYSEYIEEMAPWWERWGGDWADSRRQMMELLQEEDRLQEIVKLVGADVLPDLQRLILITAEMFKTGFLQQNAFDRLDMYCAPAKQMALLRAFVTFYRRARGIIQKGAPIVRIRELAITGKLRRAKSNIPNGDEDAIRGLMEELNGQLDELEGHYQ